MSKAKNLKELRQALNPRPLKIEELDELFVETSAARDPKISRRFEIRERLEETDVKILLAGHAGSGKSTELVKLRTELGGEYVFAELSAIQDGDPGSNTVEVVLLLIVEAVLGALRAEKLQIPDERIRPVYDWFSETFDVSEKDLQFTAEANAGVSSKDSLWGKLIGLSATLKAGVRAGSKHLVKTVREEERRLAELSQRCRELVLDAKLELKAQDKELLLVVEDLDKAQVEEAADLFIKNPVILSGLPLKVVFTAPIFLLCNPRAGIIESYFEVVTIPMIKVVTQSGEPYEPGWQVIRDILANRVDLDEGGLLSHSGLELAIEKTGGVLRHLFKALHYAAMAAGQAKAQGEREIEQITRGDVRYGLNRTKAELVRGIGVMGLPEEFKGITIDHLYERLRELRGKSQRVGSDRVNLLLLQAHALVEYNGEQWHRIHPLVEEHLEETAQPVQETTPES